MAASINLGDGRFILGLISGLALAGCTMFFVRSLSCRTAAKSSAAVSTKRYKGDCKMVILVRTDLNMGKGKAAAQCCHAVLETYKSGMAKTPAFVEAWENQGQPKITLKVETEGELDGLVRKAREMGVSAASIRDAGRTQLTPGTKTVAAIGPGTDGCLSLYDIL